jgi:cytochrome c-type biogenesis protein CcmE
MKPEPREDQPGPVEVRDADREARSGLSPLVKVGVVFTMLGGALALLWFSTTAQDAFVYSKLVDEVLRDPSGFKGRVVRVEGDLKQGSVKFKETPCEWRFVIGSKGQEMPVRFPQCIVPDTFKDGLGLKVTVQGKLTGDGFFLADQVIPRCPSKYDMKQMQERGQKMPHPANMAMPRGGGA